MSGCDVQKNVDKVIDAHGGAARWRKLEAIGGRHLGPELFVQSQKKTGRDFAGFKIPTKRRALPLLMGTKPLTGPLIAAIDIHELRLPSSVGRASRAYRQPGSV